MANKTIGTGKDYSTVAAWEAWLDDATLTEDQYGLITGLTEDNSETYFSGVNTTNTNTAKEQINSILIFLILPSYFSFNIKSQCKDSRCRRNNNGYPG